VLSGGRKTGDSVDSGGGTVKEKDEGNLVDCHRSVQEEDEGGVKDEDEDEDTDTESHLGNPDWTPALLPLLNPPYDSSRDTLHTLHTLPSCSLLFLSASLITQPKMGKHTGLSQGICHGQTFILPMMTGSQCSYHARCCMDQRCHPCVSQLLVSWLYTHPRYI